MTLICYRQLYVAPPDRHLLVKRGFMRVVFGPKENRFRPAIDLLFRTTALAYGNRVIGILLSGALYDGTAGLYDIKQQGGITIVQDPEEALMPYLPQHSMTQVELDHVLPVADIAQTLIGSCQLRLQRSEEFTMSNEESQPDAVETAE